MRVQLRVKRTAHPVPVGRGDQTPSPLDPLPAFAAAHHHGLLLQIPQGRPDRLLVAGDELARDLLRRDGEQHADRLRRRERQVERRDLGVLLPRPASARSASRGSRPAISAPNCSALTRPESPSASAPEPTHSPGRLAPARVVVIATTGDLLLVVAVLAERDLADREHPAAKIAKTPPLGGTVCCEAERSDAERQGCLCGQPEAFWRARSEVDRAQHGGAARALGEVAREV